jgi:acyl-coenzyme A synthetase/AMP-(fatty) acid ligase
VSDTGISLLDRDPSDILFRGPGESIDANRFLRDAHALAADLPEAAHLINLCQDRYVFTVALAAALLRGQLTLLSSDRSPAQLRHLADRFAGTVCVTDDADCDAPLARHLARLPHGPAAWQGETASLSADQPACVVFTSGSSGMPAGHAKCWGELAERSRAAGRRFAMTTDHAVSVVGTVPPQHMYGLETTILLPLHAAATSWFGPAFYPADIAAAVRAVPAPRLLVTTPLQLRALLQSATDLPDLAGIVTATAALDPDVAAAAERRWGAPVLEIFGATEVGSIASRHTTAGDIWSAYDGISMEHDGDRTRVTAPFALPQVLSDAIELLGGGQFRWLGRAGDMIKLGGRRASLAGLNRILLSIPGVEDGVIVAPDDLDRRTTARLLAFVIAPHRAAEAIHADLRDRIDPVFLPRRIVKVAELPRNAVGKLPRAALLALPEGEEA